MLNKLLKYDLKWTFKFLSIFYILGLFFAILTRLFAAVDNSLFMHIVSEVFKGATFSMIFSALANNILRLWVKFRQNIYGAESYLTHTLPVERCSIYLSKTLTAVISFFASLIVIIVAVLIMFYSNTNLEAFKNMLLPFFNAFDISFISVLTLLLLILFLEFINLLQCGYMGLIIGHRFNNTKLGMSVLFGFVCYILSQLVVVVLLFIPAIFNSDFMNIFVTTEALNFEILKPTVIYSIISYTIINILGFFINVKLFNKGVNVD